MNIDKYSQYRRQRPKTPTNVPTKYPSEIEQRNFNIGDMWTSFQEGWGNPEFSSTDWEFWDNKDLTFEQFKKKYPGSTREDYQNFKNRVPKSRWNWLQRALIPRSIRNKLRGN